MRTVQKGRSRPVAPCAAAVYRARSSVRSIQVDSAIGFCCAGDVSTATRKRVNPARKSAALLTKRTIGVLTEKLELFRRLNKSDYVTPPT